MIMKSRRTVSYTHLDVYKRQVKASRNYALEAGWPWKLYGLHGKRYSKSSNGVEYIERCV